jgi:hypothetical protein
VPRPSSSPNREPISDYYGLPVPDTADRQSAAALMGGRDSNPSKAAEDRTHSQDAIAFALRPGARAASWTAPVLWRFVPTVKSSWPSTESNAEALPTTPGQPRMQTRRLITRAKGLNRETCETRQSREKRGQGAVPPLGQTRPRVPPRINGDPILDRRVGPRAEGEKTPAPRAPPVSSRPQHWPAA